MSTDISIKPVNLPTASPFVSSTDARRNAVPTHLPPQKTVTQPDAVARARSEPQPFTPTITKVVIDKDAAAIVFQTVDDRTSEVVGQYPAEGILRRRAYVRALDAAKAETAKTIATDRKI